MSATPPSLSQPIVILGTGYTGRHLYAMAEAQGMSVLATSRSPEHHLRYAPPVNRAVFDLARPQTWSHIPPRAPIIWCFPARPLEAVRAFAREIIGDTSRVVVLGSTSAYDPPAGMRDASTAPLVDETSSMNERLDRVQGEEYLRSRHGAIILRAAGIYGPRRNVLNWLRQGRVMPSPRYVNLIHVEDLARLCFAALERGTPGETYVVSDGTPRRWSEIWMEANRRWGIPIPPAPPETRPGKRISIRKLETELSYRPLHPDLYAALEDIERSERRSAAGRSGDEEQNDPGDSDPG